MRLKQYIKLLNSLRQNESHLKHTHFVTGNSSVDFDSCMGSLIYAYIKFIVYGKIYIPLIDCLRKQLPLRFEIMHILKKHQIDHQALYYHEDFDQTHLRNSEMVLYDHNIREGYNHIMEIVDHHALKNKTVKRVICWKIGSCLTNLYFILNFHHLKGDELYANALTDFGLDKQKYIDYDRNVVDDIIRCGILLDTFNFDPITKGQRWVDLDETAVQKIEENKQIKFTSFDQLQDTKFDLQKNLNLSLEMLLVKDYKIYYYVNQTIAYSIIYLRPNIFLSHYKQDFVELQMLKRLRNLNTNNICKQNLLEGYFLMFLYQDGPNLRRQILFYTQNVNLSLKINTILLDFNMEAQQYKPLVNISALYYMDPSGTISRKILEPDISTKLNQVKL